MTKIHVSPCTMQEFQAYEPERLGNERFSEEGLYSLMMLSEGRGPEAFRAPVYLRNLVRREISQLAMQVFFTDHDLRPTRLGLDSKLVADYWVPGKTMTLKNSKGTDGVTNHGYFLPYEDEMGDELLRMMNDLSLGANA